MNNYYAKNRNGKTKLGGFNQALKNCQSSEEVEIVKSLYEE